MSTYNRVDALELTLLSALEQSYPRFEILVADDGSKDDTKNLIESFQKNSTQPIRHVWHPDNGFQLSKIRNKAIAQASGDYIVSIDADQILHCNFIEDHVALCRKGVFLQGHRVLLDAQKTQELLAEKRIIVSLFEGGIRNRKNALHLSGLRNLLAVPHSRLEGIRGCNMSFWKEDLIKTNGFNESFVGWGREDSELALRFFNSGVKRVDLYFSAIAYHLFHPENSKANLNSNDSVLEKTKRESLTFCEKGLNQYVT